MPEKSEKFGYGICPQCGWPHEGQLGGCDACRKKREMIKRAKELDRGDITVPGDDLPEEERRAVLQMLAERDGGPGAKAIFPEEEKKRSREAKAVWEEMKRKFGIPGKNKKDSKQGELKL